VKITDGKTTRKSWDTPDTPSLYMASHRKKEQVGCTSHPKYLQIGPNYDQKYPKVLIPFPIINTRRYMLGISFSRSNLGITPMISLVKPTDAYIPSAI
jgi:hypothetical protein